MKDKNGLEIVVGDKVTDVHGIIGELVNISGVKAVKFEHKGEEILTFSDKIMPEQIEKIAS